MTDPMTEQCRRVRDEIVERSGGFEGGLQSAGGIGPTTTGSKSGPAEDGPEIGSGKSEPGPNASGMSGSPIRSGDRLPATGACPRGSRAGALP